MSAPDGLVEAMKAKVSALRMEGATVVDHKFRSQHVWRIMDGDLAVRDIERKAEAEDALNELRAQAALAAHSEWLRAEGKTVVPVKPTEAMLAAAYRNNHPRDEDTWATMLTAAQS